MPARRRDWRDMVLRIVAAIPMAYLFAAGWVMALARLLPGDQSDASMLAAIFGFALCAAAGMWSFAARSGWQAIWSLASMAAIGGGIAWLSILQGGRL